MFIKYFQVTYTLSICSTLPLLLLLSSDGSVIGAGVTSALGLCWPWRKAARVVVLQWRKLAYVVVQEPCSPTFRCYPCGKRAKMPWLGRGLVKPAMAGMPAPWSPVSQQQMLSAASRHSTARGQCSKCSWDPFSLSHTVWQQTHRTGGLCLYCTCCSPCWADPGAAFHCITLLSVALPCAGKKSVPWAAVLLPLDHLPYFTSVWNIKGARKYYLPASLSAS